MKNILYFILGIFLVVGTSVTTVQVMTVKPAIPIQTKILIGKVDDIEKDINSYIKYGYIVQHISYTTYDRCAIVLVKY